MFTAENIALLQKSLPELPIVIGDRNLDRDIDELMKMVLPSVAVAVVYDPDTGGALGERVTRALKSGFRSIPVVLEKYPKADQRTVDYVRGLAGSADALVAVGSGTINDVCKYASFLDKKPYVVFPTAASMNGYVSANASISVAGYKKTLAAQMPKGVFCDYGVLAGAPTRLSRSGLGDSLARSTAQFDWLLSHLLVGTPYDEMPFNLLTPLEPELYENARGIGLNDFASIALLMQTLLLSGFGMTIAGGSYPASQSEHMIAHTMHMLGVDTGTLHGEEIGVTTLTVAKMQEAMLRQVSGFRFQVSGDVFEDGKFLALFGEQITAEAKKSYAAKQSLIPHPQSPIFALGQLEKILIPPSRLEAILKAAGSPTTPEDLKWVADDYNNALTYAKFLRDRFTVMDVV